MNRQPHFNKNTGRRAVHIRSGYAPASGEFTHSHRSELTSALPHTNSYGCILAPVGDGTITEYIDASGTVRSHHFRETDH